MVGEHTAEKDIANFYLATAINSNIIMWNDRPGRKFSEIKAGFCKAITLITKELEKEEENERKA